MFPLLLYLYFSLVICFYNQSISDQATTNQTAQISKMATGYQVLDSIDVCEDDNLTYDWEHCETRQIVKAFPISDYGTKSDLSSISFPLVPEPPSISGITDSTIPKHQPRTMSDVEENYIEDDISSLTSVSSIKISNAPRKHEYGKERMDRKGNIYDKLYNACLKGELSIVMGHCGKLYYNVITR